MSESEAKNPLDDNTESETFRYTPRDKAALVALMRIHFPRLKNRSEVLRAVFRLGVWRLSEDPSKLHTVETPQPEDLTLDAVRARKERERAGRVSSDPEEDSKAADRSDEIKRALDDAKRDRGKGRKGPGK